MEVEEEEAPSGFAGRKRPRPLDEDEEDASEVPSSRARRTGGSVRFDASTSDRPSRSLSSKSAMRSALAARVSSALGGAVSSLAGGVSSGGALGDIAGLRILTPKDFSRIKKLQAGLAARGITDPTTEDIMELLGGGRGGSRLSTATAVGDRSYSHDQISKLAQTASKSSLNMLSRVVRLSLTHSRRVRRGAARLTTLPAPTVKAMIAAAFACGASAQNWGTSGAWEPVFPVPTGCVSQWSAPPSPHRVPLSHPSTSHPSSLQLAARCQ